MTIFAAASARMTFRLFFLREDLTAPASASVGVTSACCSPLCNSIGSRSAIVLFPVVRVELCSVEAAAEGADQLHVEGEGAGLEGRNLEARRDDALLRAEHVEVGRQAVLVALPGEAMSLFKVGQRAARLLEL